MAWTVDAVGQTLAAFVKAHTGAAWSVVKRQVTGGKVFVDGTCVTQIDHRLTAGQQIEPLHASVGVNPDSRLGSKILAACNQRCEASQSVSRKLRPAAIRVQQFHRRSTIAEGIEQQAVSTNPMVPMTHRACERGQIGTGLLGRSAQEIVAVGVRLHDANGRHYGI